MNYLERLKDSAQKTGSIVCMGLDPNINALPLLHKEGGIRGFKVYLEEIFSEMRKQSVQVSMFKPNEGFYARNNVYRFGSHVGDDTLTGIMVMVQEAFPHAIINLDAKRGDIATSSDNYAYEIFEEFMVDATTVHAYMGFDSISPFANYCITHDKGVYALCRTSNPGAEDFQGLELKDGRRLYQAVASKIIDWSKGYPGLGAVVGATSLDELEVLASMFAKHNIPMLIPGVGKQGGSAKEVANILRKVGYPLYLARINSSSGVTHPWGKGEAPANYAEICVGEIRKLNDEIGPIF
ncbi:MAG: orotidine-5'-phosphate decarboxylase [candidate division SR1 bacterium]|nr:orotidine-5'-phosphate decarboxylase [candidate division SR1 bacterium]